MARLLALVTLASLPVFAAPTTSAALKKAAIGSAKEDDVVAPKPELKTGPELALMRGMLWAFEPAPPEIRTQAVEDLGLLGDSRALNTLAQLAVDPNPGISHAAVRAVGLIRHPRAEEILSNIVRHPALPEPLKVFALELLPFQNTNSAMRFLALVSRSTGLSSNVQGTARRVLSDVPPGRGGAQ